MFLWDDSGSGCGDSLRARGERTRVRLAQKSGEKRAMRYEWLPVWSEELEDDQQWVLAADDASREPSPSGEENETWWTNQRT